MSKIKISKSIAKSSRIAIVVAEFNENITGNLLDACINELVKQGTLKKNIQIIWVPGAFEIPLVAKKCAAKKTCDAVICLGAVIKGDTLHYELVSEMSAFGLQQVALETTKPIIYEILACDTVKLAQDRSKKKGYNKGQVAAIAALEMIQVLRDIK